MPIQLEIEEEICEARCVATADLDTFTDYYELDTNQWISDKMKHLPFRSIIDKGDTANGATHRFMTQFGFRINVLPLKPAVVKLSKNEKYVGSKAVHGKIIIGKVEVEPAITVEDCLEYLLGLDSPDKACFICVPESVITITKAIDRYNQITAESPIDVKDIAVLFDESHLIITEHYRKALYEILVSLTAIFPKLSLVSATPLYFSDPYLNNHFRRVTIRSKDRVSPKINTVFAESLLPSLIKILRERMDLPNKIFLYLNYVEHMRLVTHIIEHEYKDSVSLYCKDDLKHKVTLRELYDRIVPDNSDQPFKKLNIYTSRGNSSWGVEEEDSIMIYATDTNISSCIESIVVQGKQWLGRPRKDFPAKELIHITTVDESLGKKHKCEDFIKNALYARERYIDAIKDECPDEEFKNNILESIIKSSSIKHSRKSGAPELPLIAVSEEGEVGIDYGNLDYHKYRAKTNSQYLNRNTVEMAWVECGGTPVVESCDKTWDLEDKKLKRKSTGAKANLRAIVDIMQDLEAIEGTDLENNVYKECVESYPDVHNWYKLLGIKAFENNSYNYHKIEKIYTEKRDNSVLLSLDYIEQVYRYFNSGEVYSNDYIKKKLTMLNIKFEVKKTAFSDDIKLYFNTPKNKTNTKKNQVQINGWELISRKYDRIIKE